MKTITVIDDLPVDMIVHLLGGPEQLAAQELIRLVRQAYEVGVEVGTLVDAPDRPKPLIISDGLIGLGSLNASIDTLGPCNMVLEFPTAESAVMFQLKRENWL